MISSAAQAFWAEIERASIAIASYPEWLRTMLERTKRAREWQRSLEMPTPLHGSAQNDDARSEKGER